MSDTLRAACEATVLRAAITPHRTFRMRRLLGIAGLLIAFAAAVPQADAHKVPRLSLTQVLDQLRRDIAAVAASDPTPIDTVMKRYADTRRQSFDIASPDPEEDPSEAAPPTQPAGVTDAEWHALQAYRAHTTSEADDISENRSHHYTLIDLDDDGQRDLLDDAYVGGTGLFTQITVLQGHTDGFRAATATPTGTPADRDADSGFSINGRGGDQALYWLRIDGRSYAAYRDGDYFQDTLTLSRPLSPLPAERHPTQALQIRYRYQHTLAAPRKDAAERLPEERQADDWLAQHPALRAAVDAQLQHLRLDAQGRQRSPDPEARCPVPAESSDPELEAQWPWHDAGHYTFDFVANLRVRHGSDCYSASVVAFRSSFQSANTACCVLWLYDAPGNQVANLSLLSKRTRSGIALITAAPVDASQD
ncbi:hypothetical protein [Xanthomonas campestris]|uniref:hypothetical protein n=1 Tax=Xanthomonas campestris TaxID=339 RepID=UPI0036DEC14F